MNNHEHPWTKGDNYSDMQNPMQDLPQLYTPQIILCIITMNIHAAGIKGK